MYVLHKKQTHAERAAQFNTKPPKSRVTQAECVTQMKNTIKLCSLDPKTQEYCASYLEKTRAKDVNTVYEHQPFESPVTQLHCVFTLCLQ